MRLDVGLKTFREKIKSSIEGILNDASFIYEIIVTTKVREIRSILGNRGGETVYVSNKITSSANVEDCASKFFCEE